MGNDSEIAKTQAIIVSVFARVFDLPAESIKGDLLFSDAFSADQEGLRSFVVRLEDALKIPIGEVAIERCRTVSELAAYCVAHKASLGTGGRMYIVVCRMPDGKVCERHYRAKRHEAAAQLAIDNGAAEVLSVEREDAEDRVVSVRGGFWGKFMLPLLLGALAAIGGVAAFWWYRGCPKLW